MLKASETNVKSDDTLDTYTRYVDAVTFFNDVVRERANPLKRKRDNRAEQYLRESFKHAESVVEAVEAFGFELLFERNPLDTRVFSQTIFRALDLLIYRTYDTGMKTPMVEELLEHYRKVENTFGNAVDRQLLTSSALYKNGWETHFPRTGGNHVFILNTPDVKDFTNLIVGEDFKNALHIMSSQFPSSATTCSAFRINRSRPGENIFGQSSVNIFRFPNTIRVILDRGKHKDYHFKNAEEHDKAIEKVIALVDDFASGLSASK